MREPHGVLTVPRTDSAWRHLPRDLPPRSKMQRLAIVSPADLHDSHGGVALLRASRRPWPWLARCYAGQADRGERVGTAVAVEIVRPREDQKGFAVQPRRWVVERTFGWLIRCRRLDRGHEATPSSTLPSSSPKPEASSDT